MLGDHEGGTGYQAPAGLEDAADLFDRDPRASDVLQDLVQDNQVELSAG